MGFTGIILMAISFTISRGFCRNGLSRLSKGSLSRHHLKSSSHVYSQKAPSSALSVAVESVPSFASLKNKHPEHPSYELLHETPIKEYGVNAALYKHKKSGAQILSVIAPDENKVFGATFRTPPDDSTGIPHILEHSVLCGSRKFPVKEPFVDLMKGSLNTFLNAFTYPDRTCYPVASMNTKDFYNLIHVYLDAVFHPRAVNDPQVLQQEGWHYELEDPSKPLTYKGVVYNEMKGVYSSPESLMGRAAQNALFPDNTYSVDSGGDPQVIPSLTFEQFQRFHATYYHPANSRLYFYGDDDPLRRLELLDEYLREFDDIPVNSQIESQPLNLQPKKLSLPFPIGPDQPKKHITTVNWLLNEAPLSPVDSLALVVLDHLLLGTAASALRKTLIESRLGESVTGGGVSDELKQATFSVGLKGVKEEDVDKVEELVLATIARLAESGFEAEAVRASLNSVEFSLREFNTGSFPRGLSLMLGILNHWIYDREPFQGVRFEESLTQLKNDLADGKPVFQELLKRLLVNNSHRVSINMVPDPSLEAKMEEEEAQRLAQAKAAMSTEQLDLVMASAKILREAQEREDSPEAKATLPSLSIDDIDKTSREIPCSLEEAKAGGAMYVLTPVQSNGILYTDIAFDFSNVAIEDIPLLPLLGRMLTEAGTDTLDEVALSRQIGAETGGVSVSFHTDLRQRAGVVSEPDDTVTYMLVRGKATKDKLPSLFSIVQAVLLRANLGNQRRAVEILRESKARRESSVLSSGHTFGATRLSSRYSLLGYLGEVLGGVTAIREAGNILEQAEKDWPSFQRRLERLRDTIVARGAGGAVPGGSRLVVGLAGEQHILEAAKPVVESFLEALPEAKGVQESGGESRLTLAGVRNARKTSELLQPLQDEAFIIPSQVNYVVKGGPIYAPGEKVKGSTSVVSRYLSTGYLWDTVRVMGGAYGGFARFGASSGRFLFLSYRDPNLGNTLSLYDGSSDALLEAAKATDEEGGGLTEAALLQAVIGTVGDMDSPMSPDQKGFTALSRYLSGETAADRQHWRDEILSTSAEDFVEFAEKLSTLKTKGSVVVFGSESAIAAANKDLPEGKKFLVSQALGGVK